MSEWQDDSTHQDREVAFAAERERLAITLRSIGDGVIATDTEEKIVLFNRMAELMTGWTCADALGQPLQAVFHLVNGETREPIANPAIQVLATGQARGLTSDTVLVSNDGTERTISSSVAPVSDDTGRVTGVVLVFRDITRIRKAEEALRASQEYANSIINSSLDMIIAVDNERRITEFNKAAQETFGYTPEEVLGKNIEMLYAKHSDAKDVHRTLSSGTRSAREVENRRKNGEVFTSLLSASPLWNAEGQAIGFMGISRDITEQKRAEEQRVRADRLAALGRLAAALAHEINNPLQAVRSTLELTIDFPIDAEERENNLRIIRQEIERLSDITDRVLRFARPMAMPRRPIAAAELVEQTIRLAGKYSQHAHIQISTDLQAIPPILAAPEQMTQVFLNLILNAIQEMGEGGHLHIAVRCEGDWAAISFVNDGPSIPPEVLPHIFEPFFTTRPEGNGLGLSVSLGLVQQHGGTINVENLGPGRGVVFTVLLPLVLEGTEA